MTAPYTRAADIPDIDLLRAIAVVAHLSYGMASVWDVAVCLDGHADILRAYREDETPGPHSSRPATIRFWEAYEAGTQADVIRTKARRLFQHGLIDGCVYCECRGDFELTAAGEALLAATPPTPAEARSPRGTPEPGGAEPAASSPSQRSAVPTSSAGPTS